MPPKKKVGGRKRKVVGGRFTIPDYLKFGGSLQSMRIVPTGFAPKPVRMTVGAGRRRKRAVGGSKFTDFFTKTIPGAAKTVYNKALKPAGNWIKDHHVLSSVAGVLPGGIATKLASVGLKAVGLGRKPRKKRVGGSLASMAAKAKKMKVASKILSTIDHKERPFRREVSKNGIISPFRIAPVPST